MAQYGELLEEDAIICVKGRLDTREDTPKIMVMEITRPELVLDGEPQALSLGSLAPLSERSGAGGRFSEKSQVRDGRGGGI